MATDGILVEWLRWVLLILTGSLDRPGGMRFQHGTLGRLRPPRAGPAARGAGPASRPELARVVGQVPAVALADEIEAGNVRVLVVTGGNPIGCVPRTRPGAGRARARSRRWPSLDVMENELTDAGDPRAAGHRAARAGRHHAVRAPLGAFGGAVHPRGRRAGRPNGGPSWWMLGQLGRRLGVDLLGGADPDDLTDETYLRGILEHSPLDADEVFAAGPRGFDLPVEYGWVHESMLPDGHWRLAPAVLLERLAAHREPGPGLLLSPGRDMAWSNSVRYGADDDRARLRIHPLDASEAGVLDGDTATVVSEHGAVDVTVVVDERMRTGVVSLVHGRRGRSPGNLTSARTDVDPLTTMPRTSSVPVRIGARTAHQ